MRAYEFIVEYKQDLTIKQFGNNIINTLSNSPDKKLIKNPNNTNKILLDLFTKYFEKADPTYNPQTKQGGIYVPWIAREYSKGNIQRLEDVLSRVKNNLIVYHRNKLKKEFPQEYKDIMRIDWNILQNIGEKYADQEQINNKGNSKVIYNDDKLRIIQPLDKEASCYYGQGTRWCTASTKSNNYFNSYNRLGPLYIIIPKQPEYKGEKYQFHFGTKQYRDEKDSHITPEKFKLLFDKYPELWDIFKENFTSNLNINDLPSELKTKEYIVLFNQLFNTNQQQVMDDIFSKIPDKLKTLKFYTTMVKNNWRILWVLPDNIKTIEMGVAAAQQDSDSLNYRGIIPDQLKTPDFYYRLITYPNSRYDINDVPKKFRETVNNKIELQKQYKDNLEREIAKQNSNQIFKDRDVDNSKDNQKPEKVSFWRKLFREDNDE